jgi:hypothetical protein
MVGVGGRGPLDEARPLLGEGRGSVEELEGHKLAADPNRDPGRPGGARERLDERRAVGRLARVEVVKRRGL